MKKIISFLIIVSLSTFLFSPVLADNDEEIATPASTDTVHFIMTVKWGNVIGEKIDKSETNFNGSISVSQNAKVSLIRTLLFEKHNETADKVISSEDPISWNSLIYGHWDGVRVLVSSPATDEIKINLTPGSITKTAKELYEAKAPIIEETGNGKEIVIKTHPVKRHSFVMKLIWGKVDQVDYERGAGCEDGTPNNTSTRKRTRCSAFTKEDFSGSLALEGETEMKLIRAIRFEKSDKVNSTSTQAIDWTSSIYGDVDGLLVKFAMDRDIDTKTKVTLTFPGQNYKKEISLFELYHKKIIKSEVKEGYGVWTSIWRFPNRTLVRAKNDYRVYLTEDGLKRHIPNPRVFEDQGLNWDEVEAVEPDEVEVLPESEALSYTEGTLIKGEGPEIYVISNGERRHITDPKAFNRLKYNWSNTIKVTNEELILYPLGSPVSENSDHPDNTLIRFENNPTVYVIEGDKIEPITSVQAFDSQGFRWNRVKVIDPDSKTKYKVEAALELGDGSLVRDPAGKIFRIDQGKKRWIRTADDFNKANFKWDKVISVTNQEANSVESGEDFFSDDR